MLNFFLNSKHNQNLMRNYKEVRKRYDGSEVLHKDEVESSRETKLFLRERWFISVGSVMRLEVVERRSYA